MGARFRPAPKTCGCAENIWVHVADIWVRAEDIWMRAPFPPSYMDARVFRRFVGKINILCETWAFGRSLTFCGKRIGVCYNCPPTTLFGLSHIDRCCSQTDAQVPSQMRSQIARPYGFRLCYCKGCPSLKDIFKTHGRPVCQIGLKTFWMNLNPRLAIVQ